MSSLSGVVGKFLHEYQVNTPKRLKVIDAYLAYVLFTGIFQARGAGLFTVFLNWLCMLES